MKQILLIAASVVLLTTTGCKKCYTCESVKTTTAYDGELEVCKGNPNYTHVATNKGNANINGHDYKCY